MLSSSASTKQNMLHSVLDSNTIFLLQNQKFSPQAFVFTQTTWSWEESLVKCYLNKGKFWSPCSISTQPSFARSSPEDVNLYLEHSPVLNIDVLFPQKGLKNVFDEAILAALEPPEPKKRRKCVLL